MDEKKDKESFQRKDFRKTQSANQAMGFRMLAVLVVLYMLGQVVVGFIQGGPEAPSVGLLILAIVLLGGGAVAIGVMSYQQWKRDKEAAALTEEEQAKIDALRAKDEDQPQ